MFLRCSLIVRTSTSNSVAMSFWESQTVSSSYRASILFSPDLPGEEQNLRSAVPDQARPRRLAGFHPELRGEDPTSSRSDIVGFV
jgi:hypothetical protein